MTPAATGTDTSGCLRVASALCGTSTIKPSYGLVPLRGIVPFAPTLDHAGPMARNVVDLEPLLAAMARVAPPTERRPLRRIAVSPRLALVELDTDVADGFDATCRIVGAELIAVSPPDVELECRLRFRDVLCTGMLAYHRRFADRRSLYSPSIRGFLEDGEKRQLPAEDYVGIQERRVEETARWIDWFAEHEVDALVEPTVPTVAPPRGDRYDEAFLQGDEISLTHYWNWTGFPVVALPSGIGRRSGLPTSVSIVGPPQSDWDLLAAGAALQAELGTVAQ
jgi:aspartyl-tRNA(Asn)/glutamyl-tRNA(Gln) amidotransferase subunit A